MGKKQTTVKYDESNSYSGRDGFVLKAMTVNKKIVEVEIYLNRRDLSTNAMRLLAEHLNKLANQIEADNA